MAFSNKRVSAAAQTEELTGLLKEAVLVLRNADVTDGVAYAVLYSLAALARANRCPTGGWCAAYG